MQPSAEIKLEKPSSEDEYATDLTIHVNHKKETVYLSERLTEEAFFTTLDQMLSSLFSSTSLGSGWMLREINGLYVNLVFYVPIRSSSCPAFPSDLQSMNWLLNIRNRADNNCFLYFYMAEWHLTYGQSLFENVGWPKKTNPETDIPSISTTHHSVGDFVMPTAFNQIPTFENLNKVQVNVFRYQRRYLIPLRIPKRQEVPFIVDLLLFNNGQAYQYLLIEDLKLLVSNLKQQFS